MKDSPQDQLEKLREEVRNVDREIVQLVGKRLDLT
jgi:chorismate mutase